MTSEAHPPAPTLLVVGLRGLPEIDPLPDPAADLARLLLEAVRREGELRDGDVLVVSSKVVSKAAGLRRDLPAAAPDAAGVRQRLIESATRRVLAERRSPQGLTQVTHSVAGPVLAAAGVDTSNVGRADAALLLPEDPDAAAQALLTALHDDPGVPRRLGVLVSDTAGRPWRHGQTDLAIGAAGLAVVEDHRGGVDVDGRGLQVSVAALADAVAGAAELVKGKDRGVPAALVRGLREGLVTGLPSPGAGTLVRSGPEDWFGLGRVEAVRAALGAPPGTALAEAVGIASVLPEPLADRVARAVRLTLLDPEVSETAVDVQGAVVRLRHDDQYLLGVAATRLRTALHAERVDVRLVQRHPPDEVRVHLR